MKRFVYAITLLFTVVFIGAGIVDAQRKSRAKPASKRSTVVKPPDKLTAGGHTGLYSDGRYINYQLGFSVDMPKKWLAIGADDVETMRVYGSEGLQKADPKNATQIEEASSRPILLTMAKKPIGSAANSVIAIEVARQSSTAFTPKMIVDAAVRLFLENPENTLIQESTNENIGGHPFAHSRFEVTLHGVKVKMSYFATMIGRDSVVFTAAFSSDEDLEAMEAAIRTFRLLPAKNAK